MQHNSADRQFGKQPTLILPLATMIAVGGARAATKLMAATLVVISTAWSSILLEIWIVLTQFRKNIFNTMLWPSASVWVVR